MCHLFVQHLLETSFNLKLIDKGILQYATITSRTTQNVLYLVKIINAKESIPWLSGYDTRKALMQIWRSGFHSGQGCHLLLFYLFLYDNIFVFNLYILEANFPLTFPDVTVTAMPVTNCIYNFSFSFGYGC